MNIYDIIARAKQLRQETRSDSITPDRVGSIQEDTLKYINEYQLFAATGAIHKVYQSVSAMQADPAPVSELSGQALRPGQLVVIVPTDQADTTAGDVYRYDGPSGNTSAWTFVAKIGALPADDEFSKTSINALQNKVVTEKFEEEEEEITELAYKLSEEKENLAPISGLLTLKETDITGELKDGYYQINGDGFIFESSYESTELLRVTPGEIVKVKSYVTSSLVASVSFYNKTQTPLIDEFKGTIDNTVIEISVPINAYYMAVSSKKGIGVRVWAMRTTLNAYTKNESERLISTLNESINHVKSETLIEEATIEIVNTYDYKEEDTNGYWYMGLFYKDDNRRATQEIEVSEGHSFLITTYLRSIVISAVNFFDADNNYVGNWRPGTGEDEYLVDEEVIIPQGVHFITVNSAGVKSPIVKRINKKEVFAAYTKQQSDERYTLTGGYGLRWKIDDANDMGERVYAAKGMNAKIGIGTLDGQSDFDSIFPWSEIKRCNIKVNLNGAKIVVFEGEDSFTLDGSNGDVFVRIPKFSVKKYLKDGYEYRIISSDSDNIHPAFIEDGKELNEIFISAFEGYNQDGKLRSIANVIPTNNITPSEFLSKAIANGVGYSLFDNRCVDLIWTLMAVEYGCRNSNKILGYGYSGYIQPAQYQETLSVTVSQEATNSVILGKPISNTERLSYLSAFSQGQNICICGDNVDGSQNNIIAQRKITSVSCESINDNIVISFDGEPISVYAKNEESLNYTYVGNAPISTNSCETAIGDNAQLSWHTGRSARSGVPGIGELFDNTANACRYRWIENPIGNLWHFLPDVTFASLQMYVCNNMQDYEFHKHSTPYNPIGDILIGQSDNGNKEDITDANYWVDKLVNNIFAKGIVFGKSYNKSLVSKQGFGAYYYLNSGEGPYIISHGGGFDHLYRCNMLTFRAWIGKNARWYLYGARLMFKYM